MTLPKLVRLQPVRRSPLSRSRQMDLSRTLGIPTHSRRPIHFPFSLANPQINAPQRIAPALLQPFVEQHKLLRLVHPEFRSMRALLTSFDEQALLATVAEPSRLWSHTRQRLFVVFPVLPQQSYVLPTSLDDIEAEQVTLRYNDPRQELRRRIPIVGLLTVQLAPSSVLTAMEQQQMRLIRNLSWRLGRADNILEGELVDLVEDRPVAPGAFIDFFSATPTWQGYLHNISRGGACLLLPPDFNGHDAVHHVVLLRLRLPPIKLASQREKVALTLRVLGMVRAVRTLQRDIALHVRFLDRLPGVFGGLFERLEREASPHLMQGS